jgi:hypothetical protein
MSAKLDGKKVRIQFKSIGTGLYQAGTCEGVVKAIYSQDAFSFIELDTGEFINTLYIAYIKIID